MGDNNEPESQPIEQTSTEGHYCGISKDGKSHVLKLGENTWWWSRTKYTNGLFNGLPLGQEFILESTTTIENGSKSVKVNWDTYLLTTGITDIDPEFHAFNAAGKRLRTIKSAQKKIDNENLRSMTIQQLRESMWSMNKQQKAGLIAVILAELN